MSEPTLLEIALARLDAAALAVMQSAATEAQQHQILGHLVGAHSLLHALSQVDPGAVDELIRRATRLGAQVSHPKGGPTEAARRDEESQSAGEQRCPPTD